jgi:hypothetical protein
MGVRVSGDRFISTLLICWPGQSTPSYSPSPVPAHVSCICHARFVLELSLSRFQTSWGLTAFGRSSLRLVFKEFVKLTKLEFVEPSCFAKHEASGCALLESFLEDPEETALVCIFWTQFYTIPGRERRVIDTWHDRARFLGPFVADRGFQFLPDIICHHSALKFSPP